MTRKLMTSCLILFVFCSFQTQHEAWIRINLAGYKPESVKVAVWGSNENVPLQRFELVDKVTGKVAFENKAGNPYGPYGPFQQTYRLDFTSFKKSGTYTLRA